MAKSTNITDATGRNSLIGPKQEDPVRPPKGDTLTTEVPHAPGTPAVSVGPGVGRLPTPGGAKPR